MKVCIIGFGNIRYMPYLSMYLREMSLHDISIFTWNRDGSKNIDIESKYTITYYNCIIANDENFLRKLPKFLGYRKALLSYLNKNSFDRLIVLHTPPAVLIFYKILREYSGKYILDYRDMTYEKYAIYQNIISRLTVKSYKTFCSSPGFSKWLKYDFQNVHNLDANLIKIQNKVQKKSEVQPIVIRYWGQIRQLNINVQLIKVISNDKRFELHFHGTQNTISKRLIAYSNSIHATNVFFHGEYDSTERVVFATNTDIIHNCYDIGKTEEYAMGNKYYDSAIFNVPQICNYKTYMGQIVEQDGLGISINPYEDNFLDKVINYYYSYDLNLFINNCNAFIERCLRDQRLVENILQAFLNV